MHTHKSAQKNCCVRPCATNIAASAFVSNATITSAVATACCCPPVLLIFPILFSLFTIPLLFPPQSHPLPSLWSLG